MRTMRVPAACPFSVVLLVAIRAGCCMSTAVLTGVPDAVGGDDVSVRIVAV